MRALADSLISGCSTYSLIFHLRAKVTNNNRRPDSITVETGSDPRRLSEASVEMKAQSPEVQRLSSNSVVRKLGIIGDQAPEFPTFGHVSMRVMWLVREHNLNS